MEFPFEASGMYLWKQIAADVAAALDAGLHNARSRTAERIGAVARSFLDRFTFFLLFFAAAWMTRLAVLDAQT